MQFSALLRIVGDLPIFESALLLSGDVDPADVRRQLSRWTRSGKILRVRRGLYAIAPPWIRHTAHPFLVANAIVRASYVSLQSALAYHGLIPEHVTVTTSVTGARARRLETPLGVFEHRHVRSELLFGYELVRLGDGQSAFVALAEKALLDLVYLEPNGDDPRFLRELRLQDSGRIDRQRLAQLARRFAKPKLDRAAARILSWVDEAEADYEELTSIEPLERR